MTRHRHGTHASGGQFAIRPRALCSIEPHVKPRRLVASLFRRRNHPPQSKRCGVTCRSRPGHPRGLERGRSHQAPGQCIHAIVSSSVPGSLQAVRTFAHASSAVSRTGAVSSALLSEASPADCVGSAILTVIIVIGAATAGLNAAQLSRGIAPGTSAFEDHSDSTHTMSEHFGAIVSRACTRGSPAAERAPAGLTSRGGSPGRGRRARTHTHTTTTRRERAKDSCCPRGGRVPYWRAGRRGRAVSY